MATLRANRGSVMTARTCDIVLGTAMLATLSFLIFAWANVLALVMP